MRRMRIETKVTTTRIADLVVDRIDDVSYSTCSLGLAPYDKRHQICTPPAQEESRLFAVRDCSDGAEHRLLHSDFQRGKDRTFRTSSLQFPGSSGPPLAHNLGKGERGRRDVPA